MEATNYVVCILLEILKHHSSFIHHTQVVWMSVYILKLHLYFSITGKSKKVLTAYLFYKGDLQ